MADEITYENFDDHRPALNECYKKILPNKAKLFIPWKTKVTELVNIIGKEIKSPPGETNAEKTINIIKTIPRDFLRTRIGTTLRYTNTKIIEFSS